MRHGRALRMAAFAVVTMAGTLHLSTAEAATTKQMDCASYAAGYAAGYCAAQNKEVSGYSYLCDERNQVAIDIIVNCQ
jgi:hypothetical protein